MLYQSLWISFAVPMQRAFPGNYTGAEFAGLLSSIAKSRLPKEILIQTLQLSLRKVSWLDLRTSSDLESFCKITGLKGEVSFKSVKVICPNLQELLT